MEDDILGLSLEAQTKETLCKPMEEQSSRLTTGSSAVYHRDEKRSSFLAADQCTDTYLFPYTFFMQGMPGKTYQIFS